MTLTQEQHAVVIVHIRHSMMNKATHVHHTTQKCFRLRDNLILSAAQCREDAVLLSPLQNRQYSLMNRLRRNEAHNKTQGQAARLLRLTGELYQLTGGVQQQLGEVAAGLMRSADALLFTLLKAQHYQWRDQLYMAVLTGEADLALPEETACPLGKWLYGEGGRRFRALPGYNELLECHHAMHQVTSELSGRRLAKISPQALSEVLQHTEDLSQRLIAALECLDGRVSLLYPDEPDISPAQE